MKTAGIIKIVIGSVLLAAFAAIAVGWLLGRDLWYGGRRLSSYAEPQPLAESAQTSAPDAGKGASPTSQPALQTGGTVVGDARYAAEDVRDIELEWLAGGVEVKLAAGDEIIVSETSHEALTDAQRMRCTLQSGKLKIAYCDDIRNVWRWAISGTYNTPSKQLTLELPAALIETLDELELDTVSAHVVMDTACARQTDVESVSGELRLANLSCRALSASTTSGDVRVLDCKADSLDVETVSGRTELSGAFGAIECDSVSGALNVVCTSVPRSIEGETISGKINVTLPADAEFTANLDTVSGDLSSEFACVLSQGRMVCGSGVNRYEFESVSGDVRILAG